MTLQEILNRNCTKIEKGKALYSLGYTRYQVAEILCNGNFGYAHNIWKKWNEDFTASNSINPNNGFNFAFNRTFGIELEIYGVSRECLIQAITSEGVNVHSEGYNHKTRSHWKIVSDSSINGEYGCEIVSPILKGFEGMLQVEKVCIALNKVKAKVNNSCGFHVHFGANDFSVPNFKNLILSYAKNEKNIDDFMPSSRRGNSNSYCKNLTYVSGLVGKINRSASITELCNVFRSRYFKLNLHSFQRQGTVEFRQHSGTTKFSKIKNWILICARMMEYAKQKGKFNVLNNVLNESLQDYISSRKVDLVA